MKNTSKIITGLLIVLLTFSCSKDDTPAPAPIDNVIKETPKSQYKLKKVETIQNGIVIKTSEYEYNSLGNISKMKVVKGYNTIETIFNYDKANVLVSWNQKETNNYDPTFKINQVNNLEYSNGKITNICIDRNTFFGEESLSKDKIEYTYGKDLFPISIKHYEETRYDSFNPKSCSDVQYIDNEEEFEYVDGNTVMYNSGDSFFSENYNVIEYDANINPLSTIKPDAFRNCIGRSSKNNMTKVFVRSVSDDSLEGTSVFENTYNTDKYLTKTIERFYYPGKSVPSQTTTINYYYY
jgi:hypothetical protein